jgi:sodium/bile acid cotransporter 7
MVTMKAVLRFIEKNSLILTVVGSIFIAALVPSAGKFLKSLHLVPVSIIVIFLFQGAEADSRSLMKFKKLVMPFAWGAACAFVLSPLLGFAAVKTGLLSPDDKIGFLLMCCSAPTIVSGIVVAVQAEGDKALAIMLTVVLNLVAIIAIPFNLQWTLHTIAKIDQTVLFRDLVLQVLLPAVAGQLIRLKFPQLFSRGTRERKQIPVFLLGLTIFMSLSSQASALYKLTIESLLILTVFSLLVHGILFAVSYLTGKKILRLDEGFNRSTTIVSCQKSLAIAIAVWSSVFAVSCPLALIPCVVFHPVHIIFDSIIAKRWNVSLNSLSQRA